MSQIALDLARARGDEAMQACAAKADRVNPPGWTDLAFAYLVRWCQQRSRGDIVTAEDVSDDYGRDANFVQPHDDRAWGAVVKRALKEKVLVYHDSQGRRRRGHGSRCDRYRVTGKRPTELA